MQSFKFEEVIDRACERKNLDKEMMKSLSEFVFTETKKEMGSFNNLRVNIQGLLTFFYGKKRLEDLVERMAKKSLYYKNAVSFLEKKTDEEVVEIKNKINNLLERYKDYISEKTQIKTAYRQAQTLKHATNNSN